MTASEPVTELNAGFSAPGATATAWADGLQRIEQSEIFWISTVRPDGRPHVTPVMSVWLDDSPYFCTGSWERKAKNLEQNTHCILTTGSNALNEGLDVVIEGDAERVTDDAKLGRIADAYESKYGSDWRYEVRDGAFESRGEGPVYVFEVAPAVILGFGKGTFSQTRWRFERS